MHAKELKRFVVLSSKLLSDAWATVHALCHWHNNGCMTRGQVQDTILEQVSPHLTVEKEPRRATTNGLLFKTNFNCSMLMDCTWGRYCIGSWLIITGPTACRFMTHAAFIIFGNLGRTARYSSLFRVLKLLDTTCITVRWGLHAIITNMRHWGSCIN